MHRNRHQRPLALLLCALAFAIPARRAAAQQPVATAPDSCPRGAADDKSMMVSAVIADSLPRISATVDSVLRDLGYRPSVLESSIGQWVTLPRFDWPSGTERETWHGAESPGVQLVVDLEPAERGIQLRVAANAVCLVGTMAESERPNSVESKVETLSAMQVVTEIATRLRRPQEP
jgi:hypothetical protein